MPQMPELPPGWRRGPGRPSRSYVAPGWWMKRYREYLEECEAEGRRDTLLLYFGGRPPKEWSELSEADRAVLAGEGLGEADWNAARAYKGDMSEFGDVEQLRAVAEELVDDGTPDDAA